MIYDFIRKMIYDFFYINDTCAFFENFHKIIILLMMETLLNLQLLDTLHPADYYSWLRKPYQVTGLEAR